MPTSLATFADPERAQAAVDRFTSNAYDLVIDGESYRARQKPTLSRSSKTGSFASATTKIFGAAACRSASATKFLLAYFSDFAHRSGKVVSA